MPRSRWQAADPFLFVQMQQRFGVAMGGEVVPATHQILVQFLIVVHLAVINHPQRPVFVRDGLMSAREVDDA